MRRGEVYLHYLGRAVAEYRLVGREETRRFTVRKKTEPLRQLERQQRPEQRRGSAQAVAPHDAMRLSVIDGKTLSASDLLFMQRAIGNRQVQRFLAHHNKYRSDLPHAATNEEEYARADKKTHVSLCRQQRPLKIGQRVPALLQRTCKEHSDEAFYRSAPNYCRDTGFSGALHPGQECYREVPRRTSYWQCPPGDQVCFDSRGGCHDSYDRVSTVEGKNTDGTCNLHGWCFLGHAAKDIVPGMLEEVARRQAQCYRSCDAMPWYAKGHCERRCSGLGPR